MEELKAKSVQGSDPNLPGRPTVLKAGNKRRQDAIERTQAHPIVLKEEPKIAGPKSRARTATESRTEAAVRKIIRKASILADFITEEDRLESMETVRRAKRAKTRIFNVGTKKFEEFDDCKTQLAAVTLERAYDEGLPVARAINMNTQFESADDTLARLKASPAAMRAIAGLREAGVQLAIGDEIVDIESDVQKTGENPTEGEP